MICKAGNTSRGYLLASFKIIKAICMICMYGNTNLLTDLYRIFTCFL